MRNIYIGNHKKDVKSFQETLEGKNINFLFGAGASMPYLKTLELEDCDYSFEEFYDEAIKECNDKIKDYLSAYFIFKSLYLGTYLNIESDKKCEDIKSNYVTFINNIYKILQRNSIQQPRRANIFSTNYDMFFEVCFDQIAKVNPNIYFNDGSYGFVNKTVSTERFHIKVSNVGVDSKFSFELPMLNLIKLHGSLNWNLEKDGLIHVNNKSILDITDYDTSKLGKFEHFTKWCIDIEDVIEEIDKEIENEFDGEYERLDKLAIVKPEKDKFKETVFKDQYYQSLRVLSQELERDQSVLIVFGFSFNDEHIYSIVKRSLMNPGLLVYIVCFDQTVKNEMEKKFENSSNVFFIMNNTNVGDGKGNFDFLNLLLGGYE